ncbi:MAG TPA: hypothetical protein VMJ10_28330 [Kofleriaceae bacterium]|nr:hypothetical protein [Kofleriaceae bacterium]
MDAKRELVVPTVAVQVHLALPGKPPIAAELFVADVPRTGRAQLLDDLAALLEDESDFVPVRVDRRVRLYAKQAIAWICVRRREEAPTDYGDDEPSEVIVLYDRQHRVAIELRSGAAIAGVLFDSSPSDRPRVVDHLNRSGRFVRLWTASEHYLIHNAEIVHVTEQD